MAVLSASYFTCKKRLAVATLIDTREKEKEGGGEGRSASHESSNGESLPFLPSAMMRQCQSDAKTHNTCEITRQEHSLHPTCSFVQFRWARYSLSFYSENIHIFRLSLLQSDADSRFRATNGCRDNRSWPFSLRRPTFRRGRSVQSGFIVAVTTARSARCHVTTVGEKVLISNVKPLRPRDFHVISYPRRRTLRTAKRMWKAADSTVSHCRRRRKWTRDFRDEDSAIVNLMPLIPQSDR